MSEKTERGLATIVSADVVGNLGKIKNSLRWHDDVRFEGHRIAGSTGEGAGNRMNDIEISFLLDGTSLDHGAHASREEGMCAMELVAYIADERHSYEPTCASELLTGFTIRLNDSMRKSERQDLKSFLPRLLGTRSGDERRRFEAMARLTITRLLVPTLERRGATALAAELRRRSRAPLGELALWLRELAKTDADGRRGNVMPRDIRWAFSNAVNASEELRDGLRPKWNWCGGELGLAVSDARHLAGDAFLSVAFEIL